MLVATSIASATSIRKGAATSMRELPTPHRGCARLREKTDGRALTARLVAWDSGRTSQTVADPLNWMLGLPKGDAHVQSDGHPCPGRQSIRCAGCRPVRAAPQVPDYRIACPDIQDSRGCSR